MPIINDPIQHLTEAKCRKLVAAAPHYGTHYCVETDRIDITGEDHFYFREQLEQGLHFVRMEPLRRIIRLMDLPEEQQKEEVFKAYHLANYHDGDDTFAPQVFKKKDNDDTEFEDQFIQDCFEHFSYIWDRMYDLGGKRLKQNLYRLF